MSEGLMQTIPAAAFDPLANMTAAVNYVRTEYGGEWSEEVPIRPRRAGKHTTVVEAMEAYARGGGVIPTLTATTEGLPRVRLTPGEHVITAADVRRHGFSAHIREAMEEMARAELELEPEPFDGYPEPPALPCW